MKVKFSLRAAVLAGSLFTTACGGVTATATVPAAGNTCSGRIAVVDEVAALVGLAGAGEFAAQRGWISADRAMEPVAAGTKPVLTNARQVQLSILKRYPATLRNAGIGGTTVLRVLIGPSGRIGHAAVVNGSGNDQIDRIARESVRDMRFKPLLHDGCALSVVADIPVQLSVY